MVERTVPSPRRAALDDARLREILERIAAADDVNQRGLARELGLALGLVNAYLRRSVRKGYVKIKQVPARRYRYYLTPKGFAEKSRLSLQYLNDSFVALRRASASFERLYAALADEGILRVVLCGDDDLVDIGVLTSLSQPVTVVGICDPFHPSRSVRGIPPVGVKDSIEVGAWIVASTTRAGAIREHLAGRLRPELIRAPDVLGNATHA